MEEEKDDETKSSLDPGRSFAVLCPYRAGSENAGTKKHAAISPSSEDGKPWRSNANESLSLLRVAQADAVDGAVTSRRLLPLLHNEAAVNFLAYHW